MSRRRAAAVSLLTVGALALAACGQGEDPAQVDTDDPAQADSDDDSGTADGEEVNLRFAWWGGEVTSRFTQAAVDAFEAEHPGITITPEFIGWEGYWDRLATTVAAGDAPDIINMDEQYLSTYAERGLLLDLHTLDGLDLSDVDPSVLPAGEIDGALYGLVNAVNALTMITNTTLLEEAGVEVPDDTTWTWDEFVEAGQAVTEGTEDGVWGVQGWGIAIGDLYTWTNQLGEPLWTEDGQFGISEEMLADWWQFVLDMEQRGAMPPPSVMEEKRSSGSEASGTATNTGAFGLWWSNQFVLMSEHSGQDLALLQPPKHEPGGDSGLYYKPSQFWSISADTDHPEEAALFLDFLVNSNEAGEALLVSRGVPANLNVREHVAPMLSDEEQATIEYIDRIADEITETFPLTPEGVSDIEVRLIRKNLEVLFGNISPEQAGAEFRAEIQGLLE